MTNKSSLAFGRTSAGNHGEFWGKSVKNLSWRCWDMATFAHLSALILCIFSKILQILLMIYSLNRCLATYFHFGDVLEYVLTLFFIHEFYELSNVYY